MREIEVYQYTQLNFSEKVILQMVNLFQKSCTKWRQLSLWKEVSHIDFISRGNILNNKVNLPYGPQTITIATQKTRNY